MIPLTEARPPNLIPARNPTGAPIKDPTTAPAMGYMREVVCVGCVVA